MFDRYIIIDHLFLWAMASIATLNNQRVNITFFGLPSGTKKSNMAGKSTISRWLSNFPITTCSSNLFPLVGTLFIFQSFAGTLCIMPPCNPGFPCATSDYWRVFLEDTPHVMCPVRGVRRARWGWQTCSPPCARRGCVGFLLGWTIYCITGLWFHCVVIVWYVYPFWNTLNTATIWT